MYSRLRPFALLVAAPLLLLAACTGDSDADPPAPTPPPSATSTAPTSDPTPSGPVEPPVPEAMAKPNKAGAMAFVEYYWDVVNYAQATGDVKTLKMLGGGACDACAAGLTALNDVYDDGGKLTGGAYSPVGKARVANVRTTATMSSFSVRLKIHGESQERITATGAEPEVLPEGTFTAFFVVNANTATGVWTVGSWQTV